MVSLFQVAGLWNLGERRWKYKMMAFRSSVDAEMYRTHCLQHLWAVNQLWLQLAGAELKGQRHQNPAHFLKNTNPFHCPWTKWLTDMLNLLNMYFANFEMRKMLCKNFYRCWMIVNVVKDVGLAPTLFFRGLLLAYIWNLCWPRSPHCSSKCNHFSLLSDLLQSFCFHQYLTAIPKDPIASTLISLCVLFSLFEI